MSQEDIYSLLSLWLLGFLEETSRTQVISTFHIAKDGTKVAVVRSVRTPLNIAFHLKNFDRVQDFLTILNIFLIYCP